MRHLFEEKSRRGNELSAREIHSYLNEISKKSGQIENIMRSSVVSYLNLQFVQKEAAKYRPTKNGLLSALRKSLEEEMTINRVSQTIENEFIGLNARFFRIESTLQPDAINICLYKLKSDHSILVAWNAQKSTYILSSRVDFDKDSRINEAVDRFEKRLASQNKTSRVNLGKSSCIFKLN